MEKLLNTILVTLIIGVQTSVLHCSAESDQGNCSCAVFPEDDLKQTEPIIVQSLQFEVSCDEDGAEICQNLCIGLAQGAQDKAPAMICDKLKKQVDNLKVAVFTKSCGNDSSAWKYTGLSSPEPICCDKEGKEAKCA